MSRQAATTDPSVVCVTPVKNEEWILERFLACAALWADHIVILDQCSTDRSREIAARHPRVRLILDDDPSYDELRRQRTLIEAAREFPSPRVVMALDADEALTAEAISSPSWRAALQAAPGTVLHLRWANLLPGCKEAWIPPKRIAFGFVDDGREHHGGVVHNDRIPAGEDQPSVLLDDHFVLHYQYAAWSRLASKQRWYQCWERLNNKHKRPIQLYRQYHFMDAIPVDEVRPVDPAWFAAYQDAGLDVIGAPESEWYHWDQEVLDWLIEYGPSAFARLDVWEPDYRELANRLGRREDIAPSDPRGTVTRLVHRWLARTQPSADRWAVRLAQRALIPFGW